MNMDCVLCKETHETCQHLFFSCSYSKKIWKLLVGGILGDEFTTELSEILDVVSNPRHDPTVVFLLRYALQALMHSLWRERNASRHGEQPTEANILAKFVDKTIRLKLLSVQGKGKRYLDEALCAWFGTRMPDQLPP